MWGTYNWVSRTKRLETKGEDKQRLRTQKEGKANTHGIFELWIYVRTREVPYNAVACVHCAMSFGMQRLEPVHVKADELMYVEQLTVHVSVPVCKGRRKVVDPLAKETQNK